MLASYLVPSYDRPWRLWGCLQHVLQSVIPEGWDMEVVVCAPVGDLAHEVVAAIGDERIRIISAGRSDPGSQCTAALLETRGELVMTIGDDDFQSPHRLKEAAAAFDAGHAMSSIGCLLFWDWRKELVTRWEGPGWRADGLRSYDRRILEQVGGWGRVQRGMAATLNAKFKAAGIPNRPHSLPDYLSDETVCTQGDDNLSGSRPCPRKGESVEFFMYTITGLGELSESPVPKFTQRVINIIADELWQESHTSFPATVNQSTHS